jgi:hypothetical protein
MALNLEQHGELYTPAPDVCRRTSLAVSVIEADVSLPGCRRP